MNNLAENTAQNVNQAVESFKPNFNNLEPVDLKTFVEKNIFYTILVIVVVFICYFIYLAYINWDVSPIKKIKPSLKIGIIPDGKPSITQNVDMDCPNNLSKYSFAFGLQINDFYCNRGFWKCIVLKGNEIKNTYKNNKCSDKEPKTFGTYMNNCFDTDKKCYKILEDNPNSKALKDLKNLINSTEGLKILDPNSLYKRLDIICKAHKIPENIGKELLCCAVSECEFF